ncbi:MAG: uracil-DNA glycosylase [Candidatus Calescibacterium sp.]|nr:uracil-DNA glycosylase [Candidatus Calescibacterium sp.]MCX7971882.1 uracil-DNA glycosylase [bacterium]MDW8195019.1 uracil-DNA glycosylase [Candidatus Calescibacterium sp.]
MNTKKSNLQELKKLEEMIRRCDRCRLYEYRKNAVPGNGIYNTKIALIGEAPGRNEDIEGLPFVGQAGKLLEQMLNSIGISRQDIFITNVIKCRPPENRDPLEDEIQACKPYLLKQIELVNPKVLILVGKYSVSTILGVNLKISHLKGRVFIKDGRYIFCTYHPAFILRNYSSYIEEYTYHFQKIKKIIDELI